MVFPSKWIERFLTRKIAFGKNEVGNHTAKQSSPTQTGTTLTTGDADVPVAGFEGDVWQEDVIFLCFIIADGRISQSTKMVSMNGLV